MTVKSEKKRVQITLSQEVIEKLEEAAQRAGVTKSAMASMAITEWITQKQLDKPIE